MNLIEDFKARFDELFLPLCEIVVGLLLLINPIRFTSGIIVAMGAVMTVLGAVYIVHYFRTEPHVAAREHRLAKGLFFIGAGLFCNLRVGWIIATFPALTMLYGAGLLMLGFIRIQHTVDLLRMKRDMWFVAGIGAAVSLLIAGIVFVSPFESTSLLWGVIGAALLADAVCDLLSMFLKKKSDN